MFTYACRIDSSTSPPTRQCSPRRPKTNQERWSPPWLSLWKIRGATWCIEPQTKRWTHGAAPSQLPGLPFPLRSTKLSPRCRWPQPRQQRRHCFHQDHRSRQAHLLCFTSTVQGVATTWASTSIPMAKSYATSACWVIQGRQHDAGEGLGRPPDHHQDAQRRRCIRSLRQ